MSPILPIAAAAFALLVLRRPKPKRPPSSPPETSPSPDAGSGDGEPPPPAAPRAGKDYVADVGLGSRGTKPPPQGGGFTFPGPTGPAPGDGNGVPPAYPHGTSQVPAPDVQPGTAVGHQIPAPLHFEDDMVTGDEPHEVLLADQLEGEPLPSGKWRVRLVFVASMTAPKLVKHPSTYGWDYSKTEVFTQRETIDYIITIDHAAAAIMKKSASTKWLDHKMQPFMFGCKTKEECGWNGSYTSFFFPRLVWNNGLELRFDTRALAVDPSQAGILMTHVSADVTFAEAL